MRAPRPEEQWVAACIEAALHGVTVRPHDDGSRPSMHDLDLVRDDRAFAACEVTTAGDPGSIELWNLVNGSNERWIVDGLQGGWMLTLAPSGRAKQLRALAPDILARLEVDPADFNARTELREIGVARAHRSQTDFPGSIYVTIQRDATYTGGWVADHGDALVTWLEDWVSLPDQVHNLMKLMDAGRTESHLAVLLPGFSSAPFRVADLLMRDDAPLPTSAPSLPDPLTHVWPMSVWTTGKVFHWDGTCWLAFSKVLEAGT